MSPDTPNARRPPQDVYAPTHGWSASEPRSTRSRRPTRLPQATDERALATRRGRRLEIFTLAWNLLEAAISITAGWLAGSTALVGFGFDSLIESTSGAALLWRLQDGEPAHRREETALRLVGGSFLLLAAWVAWEAGSALWMREPPEVSRVGIVLAAVSLIVMPVLARAKRKVAVELDSRALVADSRQTDMCAYLSAILLAGLGLNALFGWWWADPVAALGMVPILAHEGIEALRGETCACHSQAP